MPDPLTAEPAPWLACIADDLERVDRWLSAQFEPDHPRLAPLLEHAARFRGKRLRAAQVLLVGEACGGVRDEHVTVAGIIEMIHAATLVHDDVLDEAAQRRRLDCVHVEWGTHTSILLGDWIYARAFQRSTELDDPLCSRVLARATRHVCAGEIHQNLTRGEFDLSEADYVAQIDGKTAALYEAGGRLGAAYAGGDEVLADACARHGLLSGRGFQIIDDLLDLEGDEDRVGKSLGTDWDRGKMTLPLIRLRDRLDPAARARLEAAFGSGSGRESLFTGEFAPALSDAIAEARATAQGFLHEAIRALDPLPPCPASAALRSLTEYLASRRK